MRVGVDATCWANERGYGRFTREIVKAMVALAPEVEFVCFLDHDSAERFDIDAVNVRADVVAVGTSAAQAASASGNRSPRDMLRMSVAVARTELDCFFSPSVYTYFPLPPGLRAVVTIHDTIAERFPELTVPSRRARLFWNVKVWLALRQARQWGDLPLVLARHDEHRAALRYRAFLRESHARFLLAAAGIASRRPALAALAALPYLRLHLEAYPPDTHGRLRAAIDLPARALVDAVEIAVTARGALRHRAPML